MRSSYCALVGVALLLGGCAVPTADQSSAPAAPGDPGAPFNGAGELA